MALRILDTDPDAAPKPKQAKTFEDVAFKFRTGMSVKGKPKSLDTWRVTTGDPSVSSAIAELMGGKSEEFDPSKAENMHVLTEAEEVLVIIDGSKAVEDKMILWGPRGPIHECDGVEFLSPADLAGTPCGCPKLMAQRKEWAKQGRGPAPSIQVTFKLADDPELGFGKLISQSWKLAEVVHEVKDALDEIDGEALCNLKLELVEFESDTYGHVRYRKPVIEVLKSYNDAIADER